MKKRGPAKRFFYRCVRAVLGPMAIRRCVNNPTSGRIDFMRRTNLIQLRTDELKLICECILKSRPCNMLVFGIGNDSAFWARLNAGGRTAFLEHSSVWLDRKPGFEAYLVDYSLKRSMWKDVLGDSERLHLELPETVAGTLWDIIIVDGPLGYKDECPGRMQSIFAARQLVKPGGYVFIHDCDREVEIAYADHYFGSDRKLAEVQRLRSYQVMAASTDVAEPSHDELNAVS